MIDIKQKFRNLFHAIKKVISHPLNQKQRWSAVLRLFSWHLASRLAPGPILIPFVSGLYQLSGRNTSAATGNHFYGLNEFEEMAFLLHILRKDDLFVDVGANVGSYLLLAAGVCHAQCIGFEPSPTTFSFLQKNIRLNDLESKVTLHRMGVGEIKGSLTFTDFPLESGLDTVNHIVPIGSTATCTCQIPVTTLDEMHFFTAPLLLKLDVEGFEYQVIRGAEKTLQGTGPMGVITEINGSCCRYGHSISDVENAFSQLGFSGFSYEPFERRLIPLANGNESESGLIENALFLRQTDFFRQRFKEAPYIEVNGIAL